MKCWHMGGAGNDFMLIDTRGYAPDFPDLAKKLCTITGDENIRYIKE